MSCCNSDCKQGRTCQNKSESPSSLTLAIIYVAMAILAVFGTGVFP
jgi:hypothetical protein